MYFFFRTSKAYYITIDAKIVKKICRFSVLNLLYWSDAEEKTLGYVFQRRIFRFTVSLSLMYLIYQKLKTELNLITFIILRLISNPSLATWGRAEYDYCFGLFFKNLRFINLIHFLFSPQQPISSQYLQPRHTPRHLFFFFLYWSENHRLDQQRNG